MGLLIIKNEGKNKIMAKMKFTFLIIVLLMTSCSMKEDLEQAQKATGDLRDSTLRLESSTNEVKENITKVYEDGREAETIKLMRDALNGILQSPVKQTTNKIKFANIYFASQEFQFWRNDQIDTPEYRQILFSKAVELFFADIDDWIDEAYPISVLNIYSQSYQNWVNLSAMAVSMDRIHDRQKLMARFHSIQAVTMYDLIVEGLKSKNQDPASRPDFAQKVLQSEQQAVYLLQLRHHFFPLMVLALATRFDEGLFQQGTRLLVDWTLDLKMANREQIRYWTEFLNKSLQTKQVLVELGYELESNPVVARLFRNLTLIRAPSRAVAESDEWSAFLVALHQLFKPQGQVFSVTTSE